MNMYKAFAGAALLLALTAPAAQAQVPSLDARVSINVVEQDLSQVVQYLRDRSGANIVVLQGGDEKVRDLVRRIIEHLPKGGGSGGAAPAPSSRSEGSVAAPPSER